MDKNFGQLYIGDKIYIYDYVKRIVLSYTIKHKIIDDLTVTFNFDGMREELKVLSCNKRFSDFGAHIYSDKNLLLKDLLVELKFVRIAIKNCQRVNDIKNMTSNMLAARKIYYSIQSIRYENICQS